MQPSATLGPAAVIGLPGNGRTMSASGPHDRLMASILGPARHCEQRDEEETSAAPKIARGRDMLADESSFSLSLSLSLSRLSMLSAMHFVARVAIDASESITTTITTTTTTTIATEVRRSMSTTTSRWSEAKPR